MSLYTTRVVRLTSALALPVFAACSDDERPLTAPAAIPTTNVVNLATIDTFVVTSTSGGMGVGTLRQALWESTAGDVI